MAQTLVNIRMDMELKNKMNEICWELGMNMTTAFTIFARQLTRERRIPFEVSADPFYSEANLRALGESAKEFRKGRPIAFDMEELVRMEKMTPGEAKAVVATAKKRRGKPA